MTVNFSTTNPSQLNERATSMQKAIQLDEANNLAYAKYTAAGAITALGNALLKAGSAAAMTLAAPIAGAQTAGGQDGATLTITAADAYAYTVTTPANAINGADDTATWGAAVGNNIQLIADSGVWYVFGTPRGVTLSEV
jgi:hypothetical protein